MKLKNFLSNYSFDLKIQKKTKSTIYNHIQLSSAILLSVFIKIDILLCKIRFQISINDTYFINDHSNCTTKFPGVNLKLNNLNIDIKKFGKFRI